MDPCCADDTLTDSCNHPLTSTSTSTPMSTPIPMSTQITSTSHDLLTPTKSTPSDNSSSALATAATATATDTTTKITSTPTPLLFSSSLADIYIGTAGYSYGHWRKGIFYPSHVTQGQQELRYYSGVFPAVEINSSFHAIPRQETLENWSKTVKSGFQFSFKVPQQITHELRLEHIEEPLKLFLDRLITTMKQQTKNSFNTNTSTGTSSFGNHNHNYNDNAGTFSNSVKQEKSQEEEEEQQQYHYQSCLGPILFQLPPTLSKDVKKLEQIYKIIQPYQQRQQYQPLKIAFEFRNKSWYCAEVYETLQRYNFGICDNISPDQSAIRYTETPGAKIFHDINTTITSTSTTDSTDSTATTNDSNINSCSMPTKWQYIRLHKKSDRGSTNYTSEQLANIADELVENRIRGVQQYCYFLNDLDGHGPRNAKTLMNFIRERSMAHTAKYLSSPSPNSSLPYYHVASWKADPTSQSITQLFTKQQQQQQQQQKNDFTSKVSPTKSATSIKSNTKRTIDSFFSASSKNNDSTSSKRLKTPINPSTMMTSRDQKKKGAITSFFTKKK